MSDDVHGDPGARAEPTRDEGAASIAEALFARARTEPDGAAYYRQVDGAWQVVEWREYADAVARAASALSALGLEAGARVAIVSDNRPEWAILHLACSLLGGVSVAIYPNQPVATVREQLDLTGATLALIDRPALVAALTARAGQSVAPRHLVVVGEAAGDSVAGVLGWSDFVASADAADAADKDAWLADLDPEQTALISFTSGTTGPGKAVVATHENLLEEAHALARALEIGPSDWTLSYLPLAHALEMALSIHVPALVGSLVYYGQAPERIAHNLRAVQPSVFTATPRIWTTMHETVAASLSQLTGWQRGLLNWARSVATRAQAARNRGARPGLGTRMSFGLASYLVIGKLTRVIGLTNARVCLSTGDRLPRATQEFFGSLDVTIRELYGQVETGCAVSVSRLGAVRPGSVGTPVCAVRVAADGELSVRPEAPSRRYLERDGQRPCADADGWYRTGDVAMLDDGGALVIVGRLGETWAGGSGAGPVGASELEQALLAEPTIASAVVVADERGRAHALCTLDEDGDGNDSALAEACARVSQGDERFPSMSSSRLPTRDLTVEGGQLTPMFTVRRGVLRARYLNDEGD